MLEYIIPTELKLNIQSCYLPAFAKASKRAKTILYLDLCAGQPDVALPDSRTLEGSTSIALSSLPNDKTYFRFFESDSKVVMSLRKKYLNRLNDGDRFEIVEGDCNLTIDKTLADLVEAGPNYVELKKSPAYAFVDPYGLEISWETLEKLSKFKLQNYSKIEILFLFSDMGVNRSKTEHADTVSKVFGTDGWKTIDKCQKEGKIESSEAGIYRVKFFMRRLKNILEYKHVRAIRFKTPTNAPFYSLIHATDHEAGLKIMDDIFKNTENEIRPNQQGMWDAEGGGDFKEFIDAKNMFFIDNTELPGWCLE